jgi:subtilisin family serine protease
MSHRSAFGSARRRSLLAIAAGLALAASMSLSATANTASIQRYLVVFGGSYALDGTYALGGNYALNHQYALNIVQAAGGTVTDDLSKQIGVMVVESANSQFYALLSGYALVQEVGQDYAWEGIERYALDGSYALDGAYALGSGYALGAAGAAPEPTTDPAEALQWDMAMIHADTAHQVQGGRPEVQVGVLDSGISGYHVDFQKNGVSNVDCALGHDSLGILPATLAIGSPDPCVDNQFHGTHVAGTIGARANGVGVIGVAPNVTLVPVKVCDATGYCYASSVVDGITYAGDKKLEVINMSFFVDDDAFQTSTEFKCTTDPTQRAFRAALTRALSYARTQGVVAVAALGNESKDLAHPVDDAGQPIQNACKVIPGEASGVVGVSALGPQSELAGYSNYGTGAVDVAAPGGNGTTGDCTTTILSTLPGNAYGCIQGTSMASPHVAGLAALIESQYGSLGADGDWKLAPTTVESILQQSAVDIGPHGYDAFFGNGRIDAWRAVTGAGG